MISISVPAGDQTLDGSYEVIEEKKEVKVISSTGSTDTFPIYAQGEEHAAREGLKKLSGVESEYNKRKAENESVDNKIDADSSLDADSSSIPQP